MTHRSRFLAAATAAVLLSTPVFAHNHEGGHGQHSEPPANAQAKPELVTDPVCGMKIDPKTAAGKSVYDGKTYYFCSADEKAKFDKEPAKYVKKE